MAVNYNSEKVQDFQKSFVTGLQIINIYGIA